MRQLERRGGELYGLLPRREAWDAARFVLVGEVGIPADTQIDRQPLIEAPIVLIERPPAGARQLLEFAAALLEVRSPTQREVRQIVARKVVEKSEVAAHQERIVQMILDAHGFSTNTHLVPSANHT